MDKPTADEILRRIVANGADDGPRCFFCYRFLFDDGSDMKPFLGHGPGCPFVAAEQYLANLKQESPLAHS